MDGWWNNLSPTLKFYWYLAIPFSILFIMQTVLTFIGIADFAHTDIEHDFNHDIPDDDHSYLAGSSSFKLFTLRNIITFFTLFSWCGIVFTTNGYGKTATLLLSLVISLPLVLLISGLYYFFSKMTEEGNMDLNKTLNSTGEVYLTIPGQRKDNGKVMLIVQGVLRELEALTDGEAIPTGEKVKVIAIVDNQYLLVEKIISLQEV